MPGEHCSSGCPTQDHRSYAECLRSKRIGTMDLGGSVPSHTEQKRWTAVNNKYRQAKRDGLQPSAVSERAVNAAYEKAAGGS